jgi:thiol-disulfide isomerase/thioredoxin
MTSHIRPPFLLSLLAAGILGAVSGYGVWRFVFYTPPEAPVFVQLMPEKAPPGPTALLGTERPTFALPDVTGQFQDVSQWSGRVVLVNFWATWCGPCREEMPMLVELQRKLGARGLQVVGVAMDDAAPVQKFAEEFAIDFPLLVGQQEVMTLTRKYGNVLGALPYTALIDRAGKLTFLQAGLVKQADIEPLIESLL